MTIATGGARGRRARSGWETAPPALATLPTKLEPPYRRPGIVDRPRLTERLSGVQTRVVALVAPAGYGKSTAAWAFADRHDAPAAWLSADARDDDPATLVRSVAAALHRVVDLPASTVASVTSPGPSIWTHAVPAVGAALRGSPAVSLVIDDIDRVGSAESIDVLLALFAHAERPRQVVVAGRTLGNLPGPRLQTSGLLTVVDREELALDEEEVAAILGEAGVDGLDPYEVAERTEGWAAGVYLTALAASGTERRPGPARSPVTERLIEDYLRSEVVGEMADDDVDLLLRSSVLDRLSGPLCDHLLEGEGSGAALDRIERTNLFLIPLDRERSWFRYHALLGDFLRAELERRDHHDAQALRRRAATWHAEHGMTEQALEYAIAGEDEDLAAELAADIVQVTLNAGRMETVRRWFDWFEARGAGDRQIRLAAVGAMTFAFEGDDERALRWGDRADRAPRRDDRDDADFGVRAIARNCQMRDGMPGLEESARAAWDVIPESDTWRIAAVLGMGLLHRLQGDDDAALPYLQDVLVRWDRTATNPFSTVMAIIELAAMALARGDRATAEGLVRKARGILGEHGMTELGIAANIDALDARVVMSHGAADQARGILAHAQRLRTKLRYTVPWLAVRARVDLVRAHLALGDAGGARTLMTEIREILETRPDLGALVDEVRELEGRVSAMGRGVVGSTTLTMAELRLLPLLTTHLSFREIGARLYISQNTVKTQAISIYRKLDATSRSEAIERATAIGLLGSAGEPSGH